MSTGEDYGQKGMPAHALDSGAFSVVPDLKVLLEEDGIMPSRVYSGYYNSFYLFGDTLPSSFAEDVTRMFDSCV